MWIYHNNQHGNTLTLYSFIYIVLKRASLFLRNCTNSTRNSVAATTICLIYFSCLVTNVMHGKKLNKWHKYTRNFENISVLLNNKNGI